MWPQSQLPQSWGGWRQHFVSLSLSRSGVQRTLAKIYDDMMIWWLSSPGRHVFTQSQAWTPCPFQLIPPCNSLEECGRMLWVSPSVVAIRTQSLIRQHTGGNKYDSLQWNRGTTTPFLHNDNDSIPMALWCITKKIVERQQIWYPLTSSVQEL